MSNKVSVIVPVYNVEKYLKECLDSLLEQTYKNIEVIMVDDGSEDESGKICDIYASKYNNFSVVHKKNEGLGFARNTGLDYATGQYVMFLDSDDYLDPEIIQNLYKKIETKRADLCKSGFRKVSNSHEVLFHTKYQDEFFENSKKVRELLIPRIIGSSPEKKDSVECSCCASLYNIKIIRDNSIKFKSERKLISEDLVFNLEFLFYAERVFISEEIGYNYRLNLSSLTTRYRENRFSASCYFYKYIKQWLESREFNENVFIRLKRMFFIHIKMCLMQENIRFNNLMICYKNINKICNDKLVKEIVNSYPIKKLGNKQKLFVFLLKHKCSLIFFILSCMGLLK